MVVPVNSLSFSPEIYSPALVVGGSVFITPNHDNSFTWGIERVNKFLVLFICFQTLKKCFSTFKKLKMGKNLM